jgi:ABC-2 type transport system permease protein
MSPRNTIFTARRVLQQLSHDHRTLALILLVPSVLLIIFKYAFDGEPAVFNQFAPLILGIFPLVIMFIVTSIATLRERTIGTLDRLLTMPIAKLDFLLGYALAFAVLALAQAGLASAVLLGFLGVSVQGGAVPVLVCAILSGLLGMALGLFMSAFARSEFQAVQFMPAIIFPQLLTCGLFVARDQMAKVLQWFADIMPLTYSVDAFKQLTNHTICHTTWTTSLIRDLLVVAGYTIAALVLGALTIRRRD